MKYVTCGFIRVEHDEAVSVSGGTELEDAARALGRVIGYLVGTMEKLFKGHNRTEASASF